MQTLTKPVVGWEEELMIQINDCELREDRLTDWERGFIDSINKQIGQSKPPSKTQVETLDEIWTKATAKG